MARTRNPRRMVLDVLRSMSGNLRIMLATWDQAQRHYADRRPLVWTEKRENQPDEWLRLALIMDNIIRSATTVANYAREQAKEAQERLDAPTCPHDGCGLAWIEDNYCCPKCGDEWSYQTIHGKELPA